MIVEKQKCQTKFQTLYKNVRKSTEDLLHFVREFESDSDSLAEAIGANLSQVSLTIFLLSRANLPSEDVLTLYTQGRLSFLKPSLFLNATFFMYMCISRTMLI